MPDVEINKPVQREGAVLRDQRTSIGQIAPTWRARDHRPADRRPDPEHTDTDRADSPGSGTGESALPVLSASEPSWPLSLDSLLADVYRERRTTDRRRRNAGAEAEAVVNAAQAGGRPDLNDDEDKRFKAAPDSRRRVVEELDRIDGWIAEAQDVALPN